MKTDLDGPLRGCTKKSAVREEWHRILKHAIDFWSDKQNLTAKTKKLATVTEIQKQQRL